MVIRRRVQAGHSFGHGEDDTLLRRIRAHGNFTETVPLALLLLALLEGTGLGQTTLLALGACVALSRVLHAWGLMCGIKLPGRVAGTLLMLGTLLVEAGFALAQLH
jgi:uncharacterized membrane protein YecN with MAPEG domain